MQQEMQEQDLALIFATEMDDGMQIDPFPVPVLPSFPPLSKRKTYIVVRAHSTGLKMIMMATGSGLAMAPRPCF